ncbi:hypothetical protein MXM41_03295 [Leclercia adecarboxylata]|nr:hypothetical protein [Leclercia adecarboxylata]MEB6377973.1 hypothetical protein [Leclercia adecarboxylata]
MATFILLTPGTSDQERDEKDSPIVGLASGYQHQNTAAQNLLNHLV